MISLPFFFYCLWEVPDFFFSLAPCSELAGLHFWSLTKSCLKIFLVWSPQIHFFCSRVGSLGCPLATGQTRRKPDLVRVPGSASGCRNQAQSHHSFRATRRVSIQSKISKDMFQPWNMLPSWYMHTLGAVRSGVGEVFGCLLVPQSNKKCPRICLLLTFCTSCLKWLLPVIFLLIRLV